MMSATPDPGCRIPPQIPNAYPVDWPVGGFKGTPPPITFICESGYTLTGNAKLRCGINDTWTGDMECVPWDITTSGWFWALIAIGITILLLVTLALLVCCCKRHCCRRNRIRSKESVSPFLLDDCCQYGGSCDICGCIDYSGCCSLTGTCGYRGALKWCCYCCRCCREPDDKHFHRNMKIDITQNSRSQRKRMDKLSLKDINKSRSVWQSFQNNEQKNELRRGMKT